MQHQPSPAAVGVAAFVSGAGAAADRRRKEQLALIERNRERYFQVGMQERQIGARREAQEAGFQHDIGQQQALFGQRQELQEAAFANQGQLQEAGFANQGRLQIQEAADRERLWGMREEQEFIGRAWDDIRTGKSELSTDARGKLDAIKAQRDNIATDPFLTEEERRNKLRENRQAESRILSTAEPPKKPEPPGIEGMLWPSGTPGQGTGLQWDAKTGRYDPVDIKDPARDAQNAEAKITQGQIFKLESSIAAQESALRSKTKDDGTTPLYSDFQIAAILRQQYRNADALKQKLAGLQTSNEPAPSGTPPVSQGPPPAFDPSAWKTEDEGKTWTHAPPPPAATVDPNLQRLIDAARAGNTKAQQALQQGGIQWQQ